MTHDFSQLKYITQIGKLKEEAKLLGIPKYSTFKMADFDDLMKLVLEAAKKQKRKSPILSHKSPHTHESDLKLLDLICDDLQIYRIDELSPFAKTELLEAAKNGERSNPFIQLLLRVDNEESPNVTKLKYVTAESLSYFTDGRRKIFVLGDKDISAPRRVCSDDYEETVDPGFLIQFITEYTREPFDIFIDSEKSPEYEDGQRGDVIHRHTDHIGFRGNNTSFGPIRVHASEPEKKKPTLRRVEKQIEMIPERRDYFESLLQKISDENLVDLYIFARMFRTFRSFPDRISIIPRNILYYGRENHCERIREMLRGYADFRASGDFRGGADFRASGDFRGMNTFKEIRADATKEYPRCISLSNMPFFRR